MARTLLMTLAVFFVIQYVSGCDQEVLNKIKGFGAVQDPATFPDDIKGDYDFIWVSAGVYSKNFEGKCLSASFNGKTVKFSGFAEGEYDVEYKDDKLIFSKNGIADWVAYPVAFNKESIAIYSCSAIVKKSCTDSSSFVFSGVARKAHAGEAGLLGATDGEEKLKEVGVTDGVAIAPCA